MDVSPIGSFLLITLECLESQHVEHVAIQRKHSRRDILSSLGIKNSDTSDIDGPSGRSLY